MRTGSPEPLHRTRCRGVGRATRTRPADDRPARAAAVGRALPMRARARAPVPALLSDGPLADSRPRPRTVPPGRAISATSPRPEASASRPGAATPAVAPPLPAAGPRPLGGPGRPVAAAPSTRLAMPLFGPAGPAAVPPRARSRAVTFPSPLAEGRRVATAAEDPARHLGDPLPGPGAGAPSSHVPKALRRVGRRTAPAADPPGMLAAASRAPAGNGSTGGPVGTAAVPARAHRRAAPTTSRAPEAFGPVTAAVRTSPITAEAR